MRSTLKWPSTVAQTGHHRKYLSWLLHSLHPSSPVVLVGSWARQTSELNRSDIDILVLADDDRTRGLALHAPSDVQVIAISKPGFERRLLDGDDFPQWALRFGIPLHGKREWENLKRALLERAPWPDVRRKVRQALDKKATAETLLEMGDTPAASEEARYAVAHIARALLLASGVFPLSRPELPEQVERAHEASSDSSIALATAQSLRALNRIDDASRTAVRQALDGVDRAATAIANRTPESK